MPNDRLVKIATFMTGIDAHVARNELEAAGIRAQVTDETAVSTIWHVGTALGGVKLYVFADDAAIARKILADCESGHFIEETGDDTPVEREAKPATEAELKADVALRAWRAAIIGLFLCPPLLNLYSMGLIFSRPDVMHEMDRETRWRVCGAILVNAIAVGFVALFIRLVITR